MNASLAVFLLACLSPAVTRFGGLHLWVQVVVVVFCLPVLLVVALCLASAVRPGSLGRAARRARARRQARSAAAGAAAGDAAGSREDGAAGRDEPPHQSG